jgi:uncharacterized membrane protein YqjE
MESRVDEDASLVSAQVVEAAVTLARAEVRLLATHAQNFVKRTTGALLLGWLALSLAQVAIALVCVAPVIASFRSWPAALAAIAPALVLALLVGLVAAWRLRAVFRAPGAGAGASRQEPSGRDARPSEPKEAGPAAAIPARSR